MPQAERRSTVMRWGVVVLAVVVAAAGCSKKDDDASSGDSTASGSGSDLVICSDIPYEPMEFEDPEKPGEYTGFDIDLVRSIVEDGGGQLTVKVTPFDGIFAALAAKTCDAVVSSVTITDERKKTMAFTEPYFDSDQSLLVRKADASTFKTLTDLAGKVIGVQSGTSGEEYTNANLPAGATVKALPGAADLFAALNSKGIDAVVQDFPINAYRTTQDDGLALSERIPTQEKYGMAVRPDDAETLKLLNDGLDKARSDGTYDTLFTKYFGAAAG